jgi:hypothetical protein
MPFLGKELQQPLVIDVEAQRARGGVEVRTVDE